MPQPKAKPTLEQLQRYAEQFNKSLTLRSFGVAVAFPDVETVEVTLAPIEERHRGGLGSDAVNGGVLAAVFDLAIGCAAALIDPTRRSATVQLSMQFMRAVRGDALKATARIERAGGVLLFASALIFDSTGAECATCSGMVRLTELPWSSGQSPAVN